MHLLSIYAGISVFVDHNMLTVVNLGDSRAVIASIENGKICAHDLSTDQTLYRQDERARLAKLGATVLSTDQALGKRDGQIKTWEDDLDGAKLSLLVQCCDHCCLCRHHSVCCVCVCGYLHIYSHADSLILPQCAHLLIAVRCCVCSLVHLCVSSGADPPRVWYTDHNIQNQRGLAFTRSFGDTIARQQCGVIDEPGVPHTRNRTSSHTATVKAQIVCAQRQMPLLLT